MYKSFTLALCTVMLISASLYAAAQPKDSISNKANALTKEQGRVIASKYFIRGLHYNNIERPDFAALFYEKAYQYDTSSTFLILELSKLYAKQSQYLKALETYTRAYAQMDAPTSAQEQYYGYLYQHNQNSDSATIHYKRAVKKDSTNIEALYQYSILLEDTKNYEELRTIYALFIPQIQFPENYVERLSLLNSIYSDTAANIQLYESAWDYTQNESFGFQLSTLLSKTGRNKESMVVLQDLVAFNPNNKNALYEMSRLHIENNEFTHAAPYLYKLYALDTSNITYLQKLAQLEYEINSLDSSLKHFTIVIAKEPNNDLSHYYMSSIYAVTKETNKAIGHIQKAISIKQNSLLYKNHLATLYYTNNDWTSGFALLDTLINQYPKKLRPIEYKISALKYKIITLSDSPQSGDSTQYFRKEVVNLLLQILKNDPLNTSLLFEIAASFERIKDYSQCDQYFTRLITIDSTNHAALNYLGYTLVEQKMDLNRGISLINKALSHDPQNIAYLDSKIWYLYLTADYKAALQYIEQIPEHSIHDEIIFEHFAQVYNKLSMKKEEVASWTKVLQVSPDNSNAHAFFKSNNLILPKKGSKK